MTRRRAASRDDPRAAPAGPSRGRASASLGPLPLCSTHCRSRSAAAFCSRCIRSATVASRYACIARSGGSRRHGSRRHSRAVEHVGAQGPPPACKRSCFSSSSGRRSTMSGKTRFSSCGCGRGEAWRSRRARCEHAWQAFAAADARCALGPSRLVRPATVASADTSRRRKPTVSRLKSARSSGSLRRQPADPRRSATIDGADRRTTSRTRASGRT